MAASPLADAAIPIEAVLLMPAVLGLSGWQNMATGQASSAALRPRAAAMIDALVRLVDAPIPPDFASALAAEDPRAFCAVTQLLHQLNAACDQLIERGRQQNQQGAWQPLWRESRVALQLAVSTASPRRQAQAALLASAAARGLGDNASAIGTLQTAIAAATEASDRSMLAIANGNLANTLRDTGRIDDALPHYEEALGWEDDPRGRAQIRSSQAQALALLGEGRKALTAHQQRAAELESTQAPPAELAIALGRVASDEITLGAPREALALLDRVRALLADDDLQGLAVTALQRAAAWRELDERAEAAAAFEAAWAHACARAAAQLAPPYDAHYAQGLAQASLTRLAVNQAIPLLIGGIIAKGGDRWAQAQQRLGAAHACAHEAGDQALCLRIEVNAAAVAADAGQVEQAVALLSRVRREAGQRGLALPEAMATGALGAIAARTGLLLDPLGPMGLYARAQALTALHAGVLARSSLSPQERQWDLDALRTGALDNQLALLAQTYLADAFSAAAFERAAAVLHALPPSFELANRLSGLLDAQDRLGRDAEARDTAAQLDRLIASGLLQGRGLLVVHRALGCHLASRDAPAATDQLRHACDAARALRAAMPAGPMRSEVNRDFAHLHRTLAHLLHQQGLEREAFNAVQHDKSRRLLDALALRRGLGDAPPTLEGVQALLQPGDLLVDLALYGDGITAYLVRQNGLHCLRVDGPTRALSRVEPGDIEEREHAMLALCATDAVLIELVRRIEAEVGVAADTRLILVPDDALHNLPLHVVPLRGRPWCETRPTSTLPCAGVLGLLDEPSKSARCLVAGDSALNLPEASAESVDVAALLCTAPMIGTDCTRASVEAALRDHELDIIHLAVHGLGDPSNGGRASLLFGDDAGGVEWVPFERLAAQRWRCNLVVLSGCSTGVAGPRVGHELTSVARAALEAGAASVLACLWPVQDAVARIFMGAFHAALARERAKGPVDLRLLVAEAQLAVVARADASMLAHGRRRDGRPMPAPATHTPASTSAPNSVGLWAPFVLLGRPTLPGFAPP